MAADLGLFFYWLVFYWLWVLRWAMLNVWWVMM